MSSLAGPAGFLIAFGAGILSFLSPCVLPLVPGYVGYLSGTTIGPDGAFVEDRRKLILHALSFVGGFSVVFTLLGASVGLIGSLLVRNMVVLQQAGGIVLVVLGLHTLRLINIPVLTHTFQLDATRVGNKRGILGSALIGGIFAAGWTPCVGLILSGILTLAATSGTVMQGAALLAFYSLGLGVPFLASALALNRARGVLKRLNRKAQLVQRLSGAFLVLMGLIIFSNLMGIMSAYFYRWFGSFL